MLVLGWLKAWENLQGLILDLEIQKNEQGDHLLYLHIHLYRRIIAHIKRQNEGNDENLNTIEVPYKHSCVN